MMHYRPGHGPNAAIACGVTRPACLPTPVDEPVADNVRAAERRLEARGAFWDALGAPPVQINGRGGVSEALDEAVETATRVRVDDEIVFAGTQAARAWSLTNDTDVNGGRRAVIIAAFRAAGFEVEQ